MSSRRQWCGSIALVLACVGLVAAFFLSPPPLEAHDDDSLSSSSHSDVSTGYPRVYLQGTIGGGFLLKHHSSLRQIESEVTYDWDVALGAMVNRYLALHATWFGWGGFEPTTNRREESDQSIPDALDLAVLQMLLGPGLTWHVGETGLYLSAAFGLAALERHAPPETDDLEVGTGVEAVIGKMWRRSPVGWGLSAGYVSFLRVENATLELTGGSIAVRLSIDIGG